MKITFLGCGTSTGVPVIGCRCDVCTSNDPRHKRLRTSILIQDRSKNILIDTSTDLRQQALRHNVNHLNAVLFTHPHADHIHGIDELRSFNHLQGKAIPCYGSKETIKRIKDIFKYIFTECEQEGWKPHIETHIIKDRFQLFHLTIHPLEVLHGRMKVLSFRIGKMAYVTDCSHIPEESFDALKGLDLLILDALRHKPHATHYNIDKAVEVAQELSPERTIFTHLSHNLDYRETNESLPPGIELAFDGMVIDL